MEVTSSIPYSFCAPLHLQLPNLFFAFTNTVQRYRYNKLTIYKEKVFVLEAMQKNIPGGYHRCAPEEGFPFLHISERFLNILGWTEEEIKTKFHNKFMNLVHSEDHTLVDDYVAQINGAENKNSLYQDRIYRLQGKDVDRIQLSGVPCKQCSKNEIIKMSKKY